MKKLSNLCLLLTFFISIHSVFGQAPVVQWQKTFGGSGYENLQDVYQTNDKGYIAVGSTNSANSGNVGFNGGEYDYWIIKVDSMGILEWQKTYGGLYYDHAYSVVQTKDGGYIVCGNAFSFSSVGNTWVLKLDRKGELQWQKFFFIQGFTKVEQTSDGGYVIIGDAYFQDPSDIGTYHGNNDLAIIKLDANGNKQWRSVMGGFGQEQARSIKQTPDGGFIAVSYTNQTNSGDVGPPPNNRFEWTWLVKVSATGNIQWQKVLPASPGFGDAIILSNDGGFVITGYKDIQDGDAVGRHNGDKDFWVSKLNSSGNIIWQKNYGGLLGDFANSISKTSDGGYILTGQTDNSNSGDVIQTSNNSSDLWVVKIDSNGNLQWQRLLGGSREDGAMFVEQSKDGGYIIGGSTTSDRTGDVGLNNGLSDFWLIKLRPENNQVKKDTINVCNETTATLKGFTQKEFTPLLSCPTLPAGPVGTPLPQVGTIIGTPISYWENQAGLTVSTNKIDYTSYFYSNAYPYNNAGIYTQKITYTCSYGSNYPNIDQTIAVKEVYVNAKHCDLDTLYICKGQTAQLFGTILQAYGECPNSNTNCFPTVPKPTLQWSSANEIYIVPADYPVATVKPDKTTLYTQGATWSCPPVVCGGPSGAAQSKTFKQTLVIVEDCENAYKLVKDTVKVCTGQSATLTSINKFYSDCNGIGQGVPTDMIPIFNWVDPNNTPIANSSDKAVITPSVSGTYKHIVTYSCLLGPANGGLRGPLSYPSTKTIKETYVQVGNCTTTTPPSLFKDYTWLTTKVDTTNCEGTTISEYNLGAYAYIYIQSPTKSVLYYQNGSVMCTSAPNYDCLALYNLKNRTATRTYTCSKQPPPPPNTTCNTFGNIFLGPCTDQNSSVNYVYIKGDDGRLYDVRSAGGFNFTIQQGLRIKYGFTELNVPKCSQADKVINVTCAEEVITPSVSPLFKDYPFLNLLVDTTKCEGTKITEFLKGVHPFVYIETPTSATLYNGTGVFYCKSTSTYNCLALYGLTNSLIKRTFVCNKNNTGGDTGINNEQAISTYPWLKNILNINDCCKNSEVIEYKVGSHAYLYIKPGANCPGVSGKLYYKTGQFYCSDGVGYDCRKLYNLTGGTTIWKCNNSSNIAVNTSPQQLSVPKTAIQNTPLTILTIAPNPVTDFVNIELKNAKYKGQIHVFDIYGRTMYRQFIEKTDENTYINLDMSSYMSGIYMVEWRAANGFSIVKKVVKQ
jgi:hypothetical protein